MISGDRATVSVSVAVDQATAFDVFTREIDLWWRRGRRFRFGRQPGLLSFEPSLERSERIIRPDMGCKGRTSVE